MIRIAATVGTLLLAALLMGAPPAAANLLRNGSFEEGASGFTSDYRLITTPAPFGKALWDEGTYAVTGTGAFHSVPSYHRLLGAVQAHSGDGFLSVNGAVTTGQSIWRQSVSVARDTTYRFSGAMASLYALSPAQLVLLVNGQEVGGPVSPSGPGWTRFSFTWTLGPQIPGGTTTAVLSLVDRNTAAGGNDFALDDLAFAVPEPASWALLGGALLGMALLGMMPAKRGLACQARRPATR